MLLHFLLILSSVSARLSETFEERLVLKPTEDGKVIATFDFKTLVEAEATSSAKNEGVHYRLFPLSLGQILRVNRVPEVHLSLNSGKWDYEKWGVEENVGSGGEVWTWMAGSKANMDDRWIALQNALGGLLCSSLSTTTSSTSTFPRLTFPPVGALPATSNSSDKYHLRHTILPSERLCTESLTPFLKLLPCNARAGLAELLNSHAIVSADWHGMGVHVKWLAGDDVFKGGGIELSLLIRSVFDPVRMSVGSKRDWSMQTLFDKQVTRRCSAAHRSVVESHLPAVEEGGMVQYSLEPSVQAKESIAEYDLSPDAVHTVTLPLNAAITYHENEFVHPTYPKSTFPSADTGSPLLVSRTLRSTGQIQTHARLQVDITNTRNETLDLAYTEVVPWFLSFFLHTLKISSGAAYKIHTYTPSPHSHTISTTYKRSPTHLSLIITVPPLSKTRLSMDVEVAFLKYTEYVPDAQRGVDVPGAILRTLSPVPGTQMYTPPLLITLPTPDFSMPYNVIVMSSTVVGFMFANTFNMLMRKTQQITQLLFPLNHHNYNPLLLATRFIPLATIVLLATLNVGALPAVQGTRSVASGAHNTHSTTSSAVPKHTPGGYNNHPHYYGSGIGISVSLGSDGVGNDAAPFYLFGNTGRPVTQATGTPNKVEAKGAILARQDDTPQVQDPTIGTTSDPSSDTSDVQDPANVDPTTPDASDPSTPDSTHPSVTTPSTGDATDDLDSTTPSDDTSAVSVSPPSDTDPVAFMALPHPDYNSGGVEYEPTACFCDPKCSPDVKTAIAMGQCVSGHFVGNGQGTGTPIYAVPQMAPMPASL